MNRYLPFVAFGACVLSAAPAAAQSITYLPERGVGVADRARPDYDPIGHRIDDILLFPAIDVSGVYTDNFRATNTNRLADTYAVVRPNLRAVTNWNRNAVDLSAYYQQDLHAKLTQENVGQYGANALARYDVSRDTSFQFTVSGRHAVESRTEIGSFRGTADPVRYNAVNVSFSVTHSAGDLDLNGSIGVSRQNYFDVVGNNGVTIDQDFRDVRSVFGNASAAYRISPGLSAVVSGQVDKNTYDFRPGSLGFNPAVNIDRQSTGYTIQGGINLELSSLIFGTIQVGTMHRDYVDPRLRDFSGLSFTARILWNITPLTTVRFNVSRAVEDTASLDVAGNLRTRVGVSVDHELFRYIILSADSSYSKIEPRGPIADADEASVGLGAKYLMNRAVTVTGALRYSQRTSQESSFRYHASIASLSVRYAF